jgi:general secretion pathway protein A
VYESFYGLKSKPFELHPDPAFFYMSEGHDEAYTHLRYAVQEGKGFVVVTGEIGSGKTTLLNVLLRNVPETVVVGLVNNPAVSPVQFLRKVCQEFEVEVGRKNKLEILDAFNEFLLERYAAGVRVILIVDEAQNLSSRALEEVRMLSNLEGERHHLLQIILVGQPELRAKLRRKDLTQLRQRVTVHYHLDGLAPEDIQRYIAHRLSIAGSEGRAVFSPEAIAAIGKHTGGIPRIINICCDMALVYGFAEEQGVIGAEIVNEVMEARHRNGLLPEIDEVKEDSGATFQDKVDNEKLQHMLNNLIMRVGIVEVNTILALTHIDKINKLVSKNKEIDL